MIKININCHECGRLLGKFQEPTNYINIKNIDCFCHTCEKNSKITIEILVE